jgi:hypothetical protein
MSVIIAGLLTFPARAHHVPHLSWLTPGIAIQIGTPVPNMLINAQGIVTDVPPRIRRRLASNPIGSPRRDRWFDSCVGHQIGSERSVSDRLRRRRNILADFSLVTVRYCAREDAISCKDSQLITPFVSAVA